MAACLGFTVIAGAGAWAKPKPATTTTEVRGGWVNEAGFVPTELAPTSDPDVYTATFSGGSVWNGDFTGHTAIHGVAAMNVMTGDMEGDYTETFYGTYYPDAQSAPRYGSLTTKGHFHVTSNLEFITRAKIVSGTCGFAGSSGTMAYDGFSTNGGYVGSWTRPSGAASLDPTCTPAPPPTAG